MSNASLKCVYWLANEVHSRPKSFIRFCSHIQETDYLRLSLFRSFLKPCCLYGCSFVVSISGQLEEAAAMQLRYGSHFQLEDGDHWAEYAGSGIPASPACGISSETVSIIVNALFAWSISYLLSSKRIGHRPESVLSYGFSFCLLRFLRIDESYSIKDGHDTLLIINSKLVMQLDVPVSLIITLYQPLVCIQIGILET